MFLSTKGKYGLMAMYDLARSYGEKPTPLSLIAKRQSISLNYLEQLFIVLRKSGLIKSVRGAKGGYTLSRPPNEITVGDVLKTLEGPIIAAECQIVGSEDESEHATCDYYETCVTRSVWHRITRAVDDVIESITLQDMVKEHYYVEDILIKEK